MDVGVFGAMFILCLTAVHSSNNPGEFNRDFYRGPTYRAVVAIFHRSDNFKLPKCYGTLVNWQVVLVPCSCVVRPLAPNQEGVWYDHYRKFEVNPEDPSFLKAILMPFLHRDPQIIGKVTASVTRITLDPKCDSSFQYNMARIELSKAIPLSKLAWIASPVQRQMKSILSNYTVGEPISGECHITRWYAPQNITPADNFPAMLDSIPVVFVSWSQCTNVVCPKNVIPPRGETIKTDPRVCDNQVSTSRFCVEWEESGSLCDVTPGTPVFCDAGRLVGLTGFIHNSSMWCNAYVTSKQAVMEGIDLALPLITYDLRVINLYKTKTDDG